MKPILEVLAGIPSVVFGFFATTWFGWAQERPPRGWRKLLVAGSVTAGVVLVADEAVLRVQPSGPYNDKTRM